MEIEPCQIRGQDSRSSLYRKENLERDTCYGEGLTNSQATARLDSLLPEMWSIMSEAAQKKSSNGLSKKPKLDNARKPRGVFFIDPKDGELKETMENALKKLEILMETAMPCKPRTKTQSNELRETDDETKSIQQIKKTKHACVVEARESTRKSLESTLRKDHEGHSTERGFTSLFLSLKR